MSDKEVEATAASEPVVDAGTETHVDAQSEQQVPLSALKAERQKRQEREEEVRYLRELANQQKAQLEQSRGQPKESDEEDLVNKRDLKNFSDNLNKTELAQMKRDISEDAFKEANPEAIKLINANLKEIIENNPWLAGAIEQAPNRYARAYEIVKKFGPQQVVIPKNDPVADAKRMVANSKKPGSPVTVGKPANMSNAEHLKSLRGTKEFNDYRRTIRQG